MGKGSSYSIVSIMVVLVLIFQGCGDVSELPLGMELAGNSYGLSGTWTLVEKDSIPIGGDSVTLLMSGLSEGSCLIDGIFVTQVGDKFFSASSSSGCFIHPEQDSNYAQILSVLASREGAGFQLNGNDLFLVGADGSSYKFNQL